MSFGCQGDLARLAEEREGIAGVDDGCGRRVVVMLGISEALSGKAVESQQALEMEFADVIPPPGATLMEKSSSHKMGTALVGRTYTVQDSMVVIRAHYDAVLGRAGWHRREGIPQGREATGSNGNRAVYCKGSYVADLEYQGAVVWGVGQNTLSLGWGFGGCPETSKSPGR